jgi:hypothetical protein
MGNGKTNRRFDKNEILRAAAGRWRDVLPAATGVDAAVLDGKGHSCPSCGTGTDRFSAFDNFADTGGVLCRHCHNGESKPKSGDGIAAVQWLTGCTFPQALELIADAVGIAPIDPKNDTRDIIGDLCKQKRMPVESAMEYGAKDAIRGKQRVVRFPVYDAEGKPTSYSDVSPYGKGKLNKGMLPKGGKAGLHLPGRVPTAGETWLIVEGVKDAAALHGMGYNAAGMTGRTLLDGFDKLFDGCDVILVPDLDRPAYRATVNNGTALMAVADSVRLARLPGEVKVKNGDDVRDIIARDGIGAVKLAIENAETFDADTLIDRPAMFIDIERPETEVVDAVIRVLAVRGFHTDDVDNRIYQRGGKLVCVADCGYGPRIVPLTPAGLRERITAAMDLMTEAHDDQPAKHHRPPKWLVQATADRPAYQHVQYLDAIVSTPTLRADGSILQTAGYCSKSRLLYLPDVEYPVIADKPSKAEAIEAANELTTLVDDFPFRNSAAVSVWLAHVLTLVARPAVDGCCPLFAYGANIRGSGKSKLCDIAGIIVDGRPMARKTLPSDDDETRKVVTAIAIEATPFVLFDNAAAMIGSAALDAALTSETWSDRILGKSETTGELPLRTIFAATGNNLSFKADTARRVLMCQLESLHECPEDRTDFQHEDIEAFTKANRPRYVVAALTILRGYVAAGRPFDGNRLGSFAGWSVLIAGAIRWTGLADPLGTVSIVREQDTSSATLRLILDGLEPAGKDGLTSNEINKLLNEESKGMFKDYKGAEALRAAFAQLMDKPTTRKVAGKMKSFLGRVSDGRRIIKQPGRSNLIRWTVERLDGIEAVEAAEPIETDATEPAAASVDDERRFVTGAI